MIDRSFFDRKLATAARRPSVADSDILFDDGLNISSLSFTGFILAIEEQYSLDIDPDKLDANIKTVGQLFDRLTSIANAASKGLAAGARRTDGARDM